MNSPENDVFCRVLGDELDDYMKSHGFAREHGLLDYVRPCEAGEQVVEFDVICEPAFDSRANAHIYPWIQLRFPQINRTAREMIGDQPGAMGATEATLRQPMDFVIPKQHRVQWLAYDEPNDIVLCVRSIKGYLERWVMPFLDEYTAIASVARYFDFPDSRITPQRHFFLFVAAAQILLRQPGKAMEVLQAKFGKAGLRREYKKAFEYVEQSAT